MPRVAVLIPNYNGAPWLGQCLRSLIEQTYSDWHAVVGDNCSTDDSRAIAASLGDPRVRVVARSRNVGWVTNMNLLLAEAGDSEYVAILHSDDWWEPEFLAASVALLDAAPSAQVSCTALRWHRDDGGTGVDGLFIDWPPDRSAVCPSEAVSRSLVEQNRMTAPALLARRTLYDKVPLFDPAFPLCCDWLMWLRAARVGDVAVSDRVLANYRLHGANQTAEGERTGLWGLEKVRFLRLMQAEWAREGEPFPGAADRFAQRVVEVLASAARAAGQRGDRRAAVFQARLARSAARTPRDAALCRMLELVVSVTSSGPLRMVYGPLLRAGAMLKRKPEATAAHRRTGQA